MSYKKYFFLLLATIFVLVSPTTEGAILEKRPYRCLNIPDDGPSPGPPDAIAPPDVSGCLLLPEGATGMAPAAAATPEMADAPPPSTLLTTPITPTAPPQITDPPPPGLAGCAPWPKCNLYYQYVNVYYWPSNLSNTACLSANQSMKSSPPEIPNISSPSVYVVFPSIRGYDGCNVIGNTFVDLTTWFAPGELSTVGLDSTTYSFNFGDLPCPPADVGWNPSKGPYAPILAPPPFLFNLHPAFSRCIPAQSQGTDPYQTLTSAKTGSGPGAFGCNPGSCKRAERAWEHAHLVPWAPQKTAEPTA